MFKINLKVSNAVFSLVSVAAVDHASFRLILLLLVRFVYVNCFLSTKLSSFRIIRINKNDIGGHIAHVGETENACKTFVVKIERKTPTMDRRIYGKIL
jgi:hypothetical protein